jgi:hypothetical protein
MNALLFQGSWQLDKRHGPGKQTNFIQNQSIKGTWKGD